MTTPLDVMSTGQKIVGFGGAATAATALVVSLLHKPRAAKVVAAAAGALGTSALVMSGIQMTKTAALTPVTGGNLNNSNGAAFGTLAFGGGVLLTSALALLITPGSCKAPKALGRVRGRRR